MRENNIKISHNRSGSSYPRKEYQPASKAYCTKIGTHDRRPYPHRRIPHHMTKQHLIQYSTTGLSYVCLVCQHKQPRIWLGEQWAEQRTYQPRDNTTTVLLVLCYCNRAILRGGSIVELDSIQHSASLLRAQICTNAGRALLSWHQNWRQKLHQYTHNKKKKMRRHKVTILVVFQVVVASLQNASHPYCWKHTQKKTQLKPSGLGDLRLRACVKVIPSVTR